MNRVNLMLSALAITLVGVIGGNILLAKPQLAQPEHALYYQKPRTIKPFELTDHHGKLFNQESFKGKWSWVFFGYTSCPHVCAPTLQKFNSIYDELKAINKESQVLLVSVDPQRDTQEALANFVGYFNDEFIALRADHSVLFPFSRNLGMMYTMVEAAELNEEYMVDHSSSIVLVNPQGQVSAIFKPEHEVGELPLVTAKAMVEDFEKINALYRE